MRGWLKSTPKIRERKSGDVITETLGHHLVVESAHRLADLGQQATLSTGRSSTAARIRWVGAGFVGMGIKAANVTEEDLALHRNALSILYLDQLGDLLQLIS